MSGGKAVTAVICFVCLIVSINAEELGYKSDEVLVRFASKQDKTIQTLNERSQILSTLNVGTAVRQSDFVPGLTLVKLNKDVTVQQAIGLLKNRSDIVHVQPNFIYKACSVVPHDSYFNNLWGMHNYGQTGGTPDADIDAPEAWDVVTDACDIIVAVIDSGIEYTHPDLAANMWTNDAELNGIAGVDDDGNGFIDDIYGYDFCTRNQERDSDPMCVTNHGTHVAGIIGAVGDNGLGVTGVCWKVKLMAAKFLDPFDIGNTLDAIDAINYSVQMGANIINASWGGEPKGEPVDTELRLAVERANAAGCLFVAAAGTGTKSMNIDSSPIYPAGLDCENIITVMSTTQNDQKASNSYYGAVSVDLAAPGGRKETLYPYKGILSTTRYGRYDFMDGTSMAAPHVAAACALVWAVQPDLTHLEVREAIINSVDVLDSLDGLCATEGRLNLYNALNYWPPYLSKTDNIGDGPGVRPFEPNLANYLEYTIVYDACGISDTNVVLVDYLPAEVEYYDAVPAGIYDPVLHAVTWNIGDIGPDSKGSINIRTMVVAEFVPAGVIVNKCELTGDGFTKHLAEEKTKFADVGVVYVDADANDGGDGLSWATAFNDLQDALDLVSVYDGFGEIWLAGGTYKPPVEGDDYYNATFLMPSGELAIRGNFGGDEFDPGQRDFNDPNFETILDGWVGPLSSNKVQYLVTCDDIGYGLVLDGLTFTGTSSSSGTGLYINNYSHPSIMRCKFDGNGDYGIEAKGYSYPDIADSVFICNDNYSVGISSSYSSWPYVKNCLFDGGAVGAYGLVGTYCDMLVEGCVIKNYSNAINFTFSSLTVIDCNIFDNTSGIYCSASQLDVSGCMIQNSYDYGIHATTGSFPVIANNAICNNGQYGIYLTDCGNANINNNWIFKNGEESLNKYAGLYLRYSISPPIVHNNTIAENAPYGIYVQEGRDPCLVNNIVYYNGNAPHKNIYSERSLEYITASYNCIEGGFAGTGNIDCEPGFRDIDANDFHLAQDSNCINAGAPDANYAGQTDIDGRPRVIYGRVDIGADEWSNPPDYNLDGFVNFEDFVFLAEVWLNSDTSGFINLDGDNFIGNKDLQVFAENWLWCFYLPDADFNEDYTVNFFDFAVLAQGWDSDLKKLAEFCGYWLWELN